MTVNPSAAESNSRWLVGEFVGGMLQRECLRMEERKKQGTDKVQYVCVCVLESGTERKTAKNR